MSVSRTVQQVSKRGLAATTKVAQVDAKTDSYAFGIMQVTLFNIFWETVTRVAISAKNFGFDNRLPIRQKSFKARPTDPRSDADFPRLFLPIPQFCRFPDFADPPIFPDNADKIWVPLPTEVRPIGKIADPKMPILPIRNCHPYSNHF